MLYENPVFFLMAVAFTLITPSQRWVEPNGRPTQPFYQYLLNRLGPSGGLTPSASGDNIWTGANNFTGVFQIGGQTETFPASGLLVGRTDSQVLTNKTISSTANALDVKQVAGTATNDAATAGNLGEFLSTTVLAGAAVALTTATPADVATLALTAGDWDVWGSVVFACAAGTVATAIAGWIGTASATVPTLPNGGAMAQLSATFGAGTTLALPVGSSRVSLAAPATMYLSCQSTFTVSTEGAYGFIGARRRR